MEEHLFKPFPSRNYKAMESKQVPMQPAEQPYPLQQPADQPYSPQQPADQPYFPQQQASQPYPPPGYQPGYQYPGVAPVIIQQPAYQQSTNTTIVVNQQAVAVQRATRNWSSGLCGCFEDCGSCKYVAQDTQENVIFWEQR